MAELNNQENLERNIALELVRATEAAALASARYLGLGDKEKVDRLIWEMKQLNLTIKEEGDKNDANSKMTNELLSEGNEVAREAKDLQFANISGPIHIMNESLFGRSVPFVGP